MGKPGQRFECFTLDCWAITLSRKPNWQMLCMRERTFDQFDSEIEI
jgi:hypothetical protein